MDDILYSVKTLKKVVENTTAQYRMHIANGLTIHEFYNMMGTAVMSIQLLEKRLEEGNEEKIKYSLSLCRMLVFNYAKWVGSLI